MTLLGGANYRCPAPIHTSRCESSLRFLVLAAVVLLLCCYQIAPLRPVLRANACFWAAATTLLCVVFVLTPNAAALGRRA
jgi:hypothetical protein